MLVIVSYDVNTEDASGRRRLRRIAKVCSNWGQRVQFSVFECLVDYSQWIQMKASLIAEMDKDRDSLRFYLLGNRWRGRVDHVGCKSSYDPEGPLVF